MPKLGSFIRLDFLTVKPYFTSKSLLIYAFCPILITMLSGNASSGIGFGMMIGTMLIGYPFALAEKSNLDALYSTLSLKRETVVLGRYAFSLSIDAASTLYAVLVTQIGLLLGNAAGFGQDGPTSLDALITVPVLAAIFILVQSIQLPIYFKLGYNKAKFASLVPFVFIMAAIAALGATGFDKIASLFANITSAWFYAAASITLVLAVFISIRLSLSFYGKREF